MNSTFIKRQSIFFLVLLAFTLALFAIHWYIRFQFFADVELTLPLWTIYTFHGITVAIIFSLINWKLSRGKKQVFLLFMGGTIFKMLLVLLFLLPLFLKPTENSRLEAINFFIPYFLFLAFEIANITIFLKDEETPK